MDGLAKDSNVQTAETTPVKPDTPKDSMGVFSYVPFNVFRHFSVDGFNADPKVVDQLKNIYDFFKDDNPEFTIGDIVQKINNLEISFGSPRIGEDRVGRMNQWVKMSKMIREFEKQRDAISNRMILK